MLGKSVEMESTRAAAIVRHTKVLAGKEDLYLQWRARLTGALHQREGFLRVESHPPQEDQPDWVSIERFASIESAKAWLCSDRRLELAEDIADLVDGPDSVNILFGDEQSRGTEVTAVITNDVRNGKEPEFHQWQRRIQTAQSQFAGYLGVNVQEPIPGVNPAWITLLRFDTADNLRGWLDSDVCQKLREESSGLLEQADYRVMRTSFSNWLPSQERAENPPAWKVNAIVLLVLYPVVMLTIVFLNPHVAGLGTGVVTFIGNVIGVAVTGFWLVPFAAGRLGTWLSPPPQRARRVTIVGAALMMLGYLVLIAVMSTIASLAA